jgi:SAM-dependent methyltransferase
MRATFRTVLPDIPLVAGTAEALPFADASLDAVTVAQAWHWVDQDRAAEEVRRVVRIGGGVALVWNARDRGEPFVDAIWSIIDRVEKRAPWRNHEQWRDSAREMSGFAPMQVAQFRHAQELTPGEVIRRIASVSHVAVLPGPDRDAVLDEVREIVATHPDTRGRASIALPYRVDCFTFRRV